MPRRRKALKKSITPKPSHPLINHLMTPVNIILSILLFTIIGGTIGSITTFFLMKNIQKTTPPTTNDLIKEFYDIENAVHVSPHSIRKNMDKGIKTFVLVDLRSPQEYEKEHIIGAVNIPAYKDPNTSAYDEEDRIVGEFTKLIESQPKSDIIVYCYSMPCMTGRKIGLMLTKHDIFVKHLGIGWNEWRYFWNLWNHDGETPTVVEDYVIQGKDPGTPRVKKDDNPLTPCTVGDFGC